MDAGTNKPSLTTRTADKKLFLSPEPYKSHKIELLPKGQIFAFEIKWSGSNWEMIIRKELQK